MKRKFYRLFAVILALLMLGGITASAAAPTQSYTYWYEVSSANKAVYNKPMYDVQEVLDAKALGVAPFSRISNITVDDKGNLYILDSESRIVVLDSSFKLVREIGLIGGSETYKQAKSLYVYKDGTIYICDTEGHRVIHATAEGELIEIIKLPDSPLIPDDFDFRPTKIVRDQYDYIYVLSDGSYYGALLYDAEKQFVGFYGANTVKASVASVLTNIKNRLFPNNEKLSKVTQKLPYCFVDIDINDGGFIYTCNGYTQNAAGKVGQIRKLSPGIGTNILGSESVNFADSKTGYVAKKQFDRQNIGYIDVDRDGFIYGAETNYGKIFLYDDECRTLTVFGGGMGSGKQKGTFTEVSGLTIKENGNYVLVSDAGTNLITVFRINEYGAKVKDLTNRTISGDYDNIKTGWEEVLKDDANFQPAYSGIARAYLNEGDYETAMDYAKLGYDRETYAVAFEYVRKDFINDNFILISIIIVVLVLGAIALLAISTKKQFNVIKNQELKFMLTTMIHPSNNFTDLKEKGKGSIGLSIILLLAFYVVTVLQTLAGGFMFTTYDPASFNSIWVFVRTIGLVVLWVVADWMVCTLFGGKGKFREIIIVTCYSLLPIIIEKVIRLVLTNVLLPAEASFLNILDVVAILLFGLMLIIGLIKIHDFEMGRLVGTSVLAVCGIAIIVFLMILVFVLVQQFWGFIVTVGSELMLAL